MNGYSREEFEGKLADLESDCVERHGSICMSSFGAASYSKVALSRPLRIRAHSRPTSTAVPTGST